MNSLNLSSADPKKWKGPVLAVLAYQGKAPLVLGFGKQGLALGELAARDGFRGKEREAIVLRPGDPWSERVIVIGLGERSEFDLDALRRSAPRILREAERLGLSTIAVRIPEEFASKRSGEAIQALAEGLYLGHYRFDRHKSPSADTPSPVEEVQLLVADASAALKNVLERARLHAEATLLARDLINEPPSRMNPDRLAQEALKINQPSLAVTVFAKKDLEKTGMGALLGVGSGSAVPPRLVEIIYKPPRKAKRVVALVGKGITFDSGGLSLKPAQSMETMKDDMSGAAAVLGVMSVLPKLRVTAEVRGYLAVAENMPGGRAQKPGDILKAFNGKTIEVLNTDAEGRLVLADALSYACSKKPDIVIDVATLTGACVVALGHLVAAVLSPSRGLVRRLMKASARAGEPLWELPLVKEYRADIRSKIADVKNIGSRRGEAGTLIGGLFLQEFVDGAEWAHLDIAGPSWTDSDQPFCPTGGTGHSARTLLRFLEAL